jgi:hypothetical protein
VSLSRRRRWAAVVVAALASSSVVVHAAVTTPTIDRPATAGAAARRVSPPSVTLVVGDSAIAALRWVPGAENAVVGFDHELDLESCRRLTAPSCFGREGRQPPTALDVVRAGGLMFDTVVVATGYNDDAAGFEASFRTIVAQARSNHVERIVWYSLRSDVDYVSPGSLGYHTIFAANNATLRRLLSSGEFPDVVLADWDRYTAGHPEWFTTDGVHYRTLAAWIGADYLSRKLAFLDGRPCPLPTSPGGVPDRPCPDPDVTGPVADVAALYPIGTEGVLCYEIGLERRIECRFETRVIQITRTLAEGDSGDDVRALQTRLNRLGYPVGNADGVFDADVRAGVRSFQGHQGLPTSGVADRPTLDALGFDVSALP